jgi:asparagine synthase (glutamine-hydrolysing)
MVASLEHRGPDGIRTWADDDCALGHSRLSIVDLASSDQPIGSEHGCWLVQNGEIYNQVPLRAAGEAYPWRTQGDSETILAAHAAAIPAPTTPPGSASKGVRVGWVNRARGAAQGGGEAARHVEWVKRLDGIWGFALWDARHRELILCRDPLGVKPLLRTQTDGGTLLFASEAKAFRHHPEYKPMMDEAAMVARLAYEYPLDETTLFAGVAQVRPGTVETWRLDESGMAVLTGVARYSRDEVKPEANWNPGTDAAGLLDSLCESVEDRLMSDVPLGIILSGGLDSSMVAGLAHRAAKAAGKPVPECWTVAESEDNPDYRAAEDVVAALDLGHHTSTLEEDSFWKSLPALAWHGEDLDISVLFFQPLFEHMSRDVKVGLCGQGADELHGGYPRYRDLPAHRDLVRGRLMSSRHPVADAMLDPEPQRDALVGAGQPWRTLDHDPDTHFSDLRSTLQFELDHGQLSNFQLRLVDRHSMAHGLEVRVPFLGRAHRKMAHTLPLDWRVRGRDEKLALRAAAALTDLPPEIVSRPKLAAGVATTPTLLAELLAELRPRAQEWATRHPRLERMLEKQPEMAIGLRLFESVHLVDGGLGREGKDLMTLLDDID